jgi:hypothetical protein
MTEQATQNETIQAALGEPIILRWRIHNGELSLRRRHFRALDKLELPGPLRGWIHERLEWAIANMLSKDTEAVLVLSIDPQAEVTLSLDELQEVPSLGFDDLVIEDGLVRGVQKNGQSIAGTVWTEREGVLYASQTELNNATDTLARDLAETLKISAIIELQKPEEIKHSSIFLISDEFGFVPIQGGSEKRMPLSTKLEECFSRLW